MQVLTTLLSDPLIAVSVCGVLILLISILVIWNITLEMRLRTFLKGEDGRSLESTIKNLVKTEGETCSELEKIHKELSGHDARIRTCVRKVEIARFNAFSGSGEGGSQSFAAALVSEQGDGMVLSSLYTRDRMRVYAKPIQGYASDLQLTEEEQEVLTTSQKAVNT